MKNLYIILFLFVNLFNNCSKINIEYNPFEGYVKVPSEYIITRVQIYCDTSKVGFEYYFSELDNLHYGKSILYLKKDYEHYLKKKIDTCLSSSGAIFVNFVKVKDTSCAGLYWNVFRINNRRKSIKLHGS